MANPNIVTVSTINYERDKGALTTTLATLVTTVGVGTVQIIESIYIPNISSSAVRVTINHGSIALLNSANISGFTTEQISGPIVLQEGDYLAGQASANSSANFIVNKRSIT